MNSNILCDFDDVISIVNDRHEYCRFHESVKAEHKKEMERQHKERMHNLNKQIIRWLANAGFFFAGGGVFAAFLFTAEGKYTLNLLTSAFALISAGVAIYFGRRANTYDD